MDPSKTWMEAVGEEGSARDEVVDLALLAHTVREQVARAKPGGA